MLTRTCATWNRIALAVLTLLLLAHPVHADYLYTFTGVQWGTPFPGLIKLDGVYQPSDRLTGSFMVAGGAWETVVLSAAARKSMLHPYAFQFTDGYQILTEANALPSAYFSVLGTPEQNLTDAPQAWSFFVEGATGSIGSGTVAFSGGDGWQRATLADGSFARHINPGGTWTVQRVPEPATLALLVVGLFGVVAWRARTKQCGAVTSSSAGPRIDTISSSELASS